MPAVRGEVQCLPNEHAAEGSEAFQSGRKFSTLCARVCVRAVLPLHMYPALVSVVYIVCVQFNGMLIENVEDV